jgi:hypothetical protein
VGEGAALMPARLATSSQLSRPAGTVKASACDELRRLGRKGLELTAGWVHPMEAGCSPQRPKGDRISAGAQREE